MTATPRADSKDVNDDKIAQWGRSRHEGYKKFRHGFLQPAPMFFTQDHLPMPLLDIYRGRSAFLICGGPSFKEIDHSKLRAPGVLTMGLNNAPRTFRPNMWCSVDSPDHWIRSIWLDPTIQKFVPISHASRYIFNSDSWKEMDIRVGDCPNCVYYKRNEHFQPKQYLWEDCINWGNHKDHGGGRSVMMAAVRILFLLGIRNLYLLGADFNMSEQAGYHFDQARHKGSVKGNASTYEKMNGWFAQLRPLFEEQNFTVRNCNEKSNLKAFDFCTLDEALTDMHSHMDFVDVTKERTYGLYDTKIEDKRKMKAPPEPPQLKAAA